ncbi:hypothetical protein HER39_03745 [Arthrobacter deserti]|uniref:Uncharacterized protein n=1 Tax=Arthrobacter deserti TaxID=1742687 RepID=A0ABX1JK52_9MICC|nr:hypothetical protein [Arthrobacter deserti]
MAVETPRSLEAVPVPARTSGPVRGGSDAAAGSERASQARARDREARQTYNALTGALPKIVPPAGAVPTRRQLRMQQLEREQGVPAGPGVSAPVPVQPPAGRQVPAVLPTQDSAAASGPVEDAAYEPGRPALEGGRRDRRERRRARPGDGAAEAGLTAEEAVAAREELMEHAAGLADLIETEAGQDPSKVDLKLLAEQKALAERAAVLNRRAADKQRLSEQTKHGRGAASLPAIVRDPVSAPMEFVRLPGSDRAVMRPAATPYVPVITDPTPAQQPAPGNRAVRNASGTPAAQPEARTRPVSKLKPAPKTGTAPRTGPVSKVEPAAKSAAPATEPVSVVRPAAKPAPQAGAPSGGRSRLLAKAEAAAGGAPAARPRSTEPANRRAAETSAGRSEASAARRGPVAAARRSEAPAGRRAEAPAARRSPAPATRRREVLAAAVVEGDIQPLRATRAHGLEPLDAHTAGLAKANRDRLLVIGSLALGGLAFALGLIMMLIGLSQ